jgi:hypothetical protein
MYWYIPDDRNNFDVGCLCVEIFLRKLGYAGLPFWCRVKFVLVILCVTQRAVYAWNDVFWIFYHNVWRQFPVVMLFLCHSDKFKVNSVL